MSEHGHCPKCNVDLDGGSIWQYFYDSSVLSGMSHEDSQKKADDVAQMYGATRERGQWGRAIGLTNNDRIYAWVCPDCKHEWGRT